MAREIRQNPKDEERMAELEQKIREKTDDLHHGQSMLPTPEEIRKRNIIRKMRES